MCGPGIEITWLIEEDEKNKKKKKKRKTKR